MFDRIVALCRPGFEKECAAELQFHLQQLALPCYINARDDEGYLQVVATQGDITSVFESLRFDELIFCRQWFAASPRLDELPEQDRLSPLLAHIVSLGMHFDSIELAWPDTNEGKSISGFCGKFSPHLDKALRQHGLLQQRAAQRLFLLFLDSSSVFVGMAKRDNCSPWPMGIRHLRMPADAPSRSTLKLEEALDWFITDEQRRQFIKAGMQAVDLGAAPGGWSWQLTRHGMLVTAVDNGPMQQQLMDSGMVEHVRADAFKWMPDKAVDWMVCDMVERPLHVARMVSRWFTRHRCHYSIFNLKLPMNKRFQAVSECLALLHRQMSDAGIAHALMAKHLYHDREEITVFCRKLHPGELGE